MAAIAGRCVFRQSPAAFWDYHDWIFEHQGDITPENLKAKFLEFTNDKSEEIDVLRLAQCFDARATEAEVNESIAEARELAVNATPTLFVNGRRISSQIAWPRLQQIIDMEIQYQRTAMPAGDDSCCAVELPIPLNHY